MASKYNASNSLSYKVIDTFKVLKSKLDHLEGKRYYNNFQERDFLRDLKIPPFFPAT